MGLRPLAVGVFGTVAQMRRAGRTDARIHLALRANEEGYALLETFEVDGTTLYNSIYRVDDHMLINAHLWGMNAYGAPLWHLRRVPDAQPSMFDIYLASFDEVWSTATTVEG